MERKNGGLTDSAVEPLVDLLYNISNNINAMVHRQEKLQAKLDELPIKIMAANYLK